MWPAEHLTRDNQWDYWHPFLPFLGDEVTGKTVAVIGTGRIGLAFIKKCSGFDMNILCYDPAYENHAFVKTIQEINDLRHARGLTREKNWIKYVPFEQALGEADFVSIHVPLIRPGESSTPTHHLFNEQTLRLMKPTAYVVNTSVRGPVVDPNALRCAPCAKTGSPARLSTFTKRNRCPPTLHCAIPPSPTAAGLCPTLPARPTPLASPPIPIKAWPDAAFRA